MKNTVKKICTAILIISIVFCITAVKMYAKGRESQNVLPAVDILVIEADNAQGYN